MFTPSTPFQILITDLHCALSACESTYHPGEQPQSLLVFANKDKSEERHHWLSRACPAPLAQRLLVEIKSRGFYAGVLSQPAKRPVRTRVVDALHGYKQRRIGIALIAHRAARRAVFEAGGLGELYINAGLQLQTLAMKFKSSLCAIRRAEHFAKCVRLSAHHALLARELGTRH